MVHEYPPPPGAAEFSELIKRRLADVKSSGGTRETVTVEWNDQPLPVEVIDLPLNKLYLNPGTHRIRAQRSHDPSRDEGLDQDPWGAASQDYLQFLLQALPADPNRRDTDFDKLKEDLEKYGQNDPGLVTHHGILVNGNSRAAALREIGAQSMRVGVLPESFTWVDINAVELSLQLRKDHRRDYSYINGLIAIEEQAALGRPPSMIAKDFRIRESTYHQARWILSTIRELIDRSVHNGVALRLVDFENEAEKFKELHRLYEKIVMVDRDRAEVVKETRLAAILLGFAKTQVRAFNAEFVESKGIDSLVPASMNTVVGRTAPSTVSVPGLGVSVPSASSVLSTARALNTELLRAKAITRSSSELPSNDQTRAGSLLSDAHYAFEEVILAAEREARVQRRKQLAPARLHEACAAIEGCIDEFVKARSSRSLDEEAFEEAVVDLHNILRRLAQQTSRSFPDPGPGVAWLLESAALEAS